MKIISESGLYKIIMRSDKPEARAFQDWVTGTVLPAIRKDGKFSQKL
ncbi:Bro-N domain-containing protein [Tritonibacter mobilis]